MAQSIEDKLRRVNGMLDDACYPFRLESDVIDSICRRFFLSWVNDEHQELAEVYLVSNAHAWLDGLRSGIQVGLNGDTLDFPPSEGCSLCFGQGFCECQVDHSGRDWNAHLPMSKADKTIRKVIEIMTTDPNWSMDTLDAIRDELFVGGYIQEGEWPQ